MLLPEEAYPVDHLLGAGTSRLETRGESRVFPLEEVDSLRRHDSFHASRLESLEARLGLQCTPAKGGQLVTEMLHQLLQLRKRGGFRPYAV
jgi:hypothetical protein